jgi:hypothetical protein
LVFEKYANFVAQNWQKSQKIVIITSTPGTDCREIFSSKKMEKKMAPSTQNILCQKCMKKSKKPLKIVNNRQA